MRNSYAMLLVLPLLLLLVAQGCYTRHSVARDDLSRIQSGTKERVVNLKGQDGNELVVTETTGVEVVDHDGLSYKLQPFTFKMTATQLVAPEQDLVLPLGTIERVDVRQLSAVGTLGLVGLGVVGAAGMVIGIVATAGEDAGFQ